MELRQLRYLVAVAEERSFTRAAERVNVTQPGISAQIRRLERELGQDLLDRSGRTVELTAVGVAVMPYARAALAAVEGARLAVDELTGLLRGRLAIGTVTLHKVDLPSLLSDYRRDHPAIDITLVQANPDQLVEQLLAGTLDAALISVGDALPTGLRGHVIHEQPIVVGVPPDHELAGRARITVADLRGLPLVCSPRGSGLRDQLDRACAGAGISPHIAFEAADIMVLIGSAIHGLGVAVLPHSLTVDQGPRLTAVPIDPPLTTRLVLAWRGDRARSPASRDFVARFQRLLTAGPGAVRPTTPPRTVVSGGVSGGVSGDGPFDPA